jgi:hypothetical protein
MNFSFSKNDYLKKKKTKNGQRYLNHSRDSAEFYDLTATTPSSRNWRGLRLFSIPSERWEFCDACGVRGSLLPRPALYNEPVTVVFTGSATCQIRIEMQMQRVYFFSGFLFFDVLQLQKKKTIKPSP